MSVTASVYETERGPMTGNGAALALALVVMVAFLLHCPILKPWFGFRKPKGHPGRWFQ